MTAQPDVVVLSESWSLLLLTQQLLTGKIEIQAEILDRWRYAANTDGCWMTHRDTRHEFDGNELLRLLAAHFNIHIQILPFVRQISTC